MIPTPLTDAQARSAVLSVSPALGAPLPTLTVAPEIVEAAQANAAEGRYGKTILSALVRTGRHVYGGTVPAKEIARRRRANKIARSSRKANR